MKIPFSNLIGSIAPKQKSRQDPVDLFSEEAFQNPYSLYEELRKQGPVVEVASGGYALTGYHGLSKAFRNPGLRNTPSRFSILKAANAEIYNAANYALHAIPFRDGAEHQKIRKACLHALAAIPAPSFDTCKQIADDTIQTVSLREQFEIIEDLSSPYVNKVMCEWFDLPQTDGEQLARWSQDLVSIFAPLSDRSKLDQINTTVSDFRSYFHYRLENNTNSNNLLEIINQQVASQGGELNDVIDNAILIYIDGIENVRYGAGNVAMEVLRYPNFHRQIINSSKTAELATQEALRLHTPASIISRVAESDITLHEVEIRKGTPVYLLISSANRDPNVFKNPELFIPERDEKALILFGQGAHSCLGGNTAITMIAALLQSMIQSGFCDAPNHTQVTFIPRFGHRWPTAVPIRK